MTEKTEAAHVIARLLASRQTPLNEVPHLIENVERALSTLDAKVPPPKKAAAPLETKSVPRKKREAAVAVAREPRVAPSPVVVESVEPKAAPPTLLRRAEVIHVAPVAPPAPIFAPAATNHVRGVVQWFDTRTNRGTLRLQGLSSDMPIDGETLAACGLSRLFKGQEVEATLDGHDEPPKIASLRLANLSSNSPVTGGTVRDRHAKQVVVELKREALSRSAARAEAELLLPSRRAR